MNLTEGEIYCENILHAIAKNRSYANTWKKHATIKYIWVKS